MTDSTASHTEILTLPAIQAAALHCRHTNKQFNANDVDDDELLDSLLFQLGNSSWPTASTNTSSPVGWQKLEQALRAALHDGFEPSAIAQWISAARDSQK